MTPNPEPVAGLPPIPDEASMEMVFGFSPESVADDLVERLNTDAAYLRTRIAATLRTIANDCEQAAAEILRLRAELARKDDALRPFAEMLREGVIGGDQYVTITTVREYFERADTALKEQNQ